MTCIQCPMGCELTVTTSPEGYKVSGNSCPKGEAYAIAEMTNPMRIITTVVSVAGAEKTFLPVISDSPIPKEKLDAVLKKLKTHECKLPVYANQVLIENILNTGSNIISSKTIIIPE
ncbi:MAG: DUF1667 domain-containing protein [Ruminococcaceae bacterium]|nr:DUF1667 domain-containing protein [Oscillospiraceae bacterium]